MTLAEKALLLSIQAGASMCDIDQGKRVQFHKNRSRRLISFLIVAYAAFKQAKKKKMATRETRTSNHQNRICYSSILLGTSAQFILVYPLLKIKPDSKPSLIPVSTLSYYFELLYRESSNLSDQVGFIAFFPVLKSHHPDLF